MNTPQHRRARSLDKQFPGCLGKMVNLFDLSAGLTSNKLLTDHPHPNGPTLSRSFSDMSLTPCSTLKNPVEDKRTVSHMRRCSSGQKSSGTLMKALIAEELSKDVETKHVRSNVIAKLMGLEPLPQKQHQLRASGHTPMEGAAKFWDKNCLVLDKEVQNELLKFHEYKDCADFSEMLRQPNDLNTVREQPVQKGRRSRSKQEKMVNLVRQKFMDAKRLVMDDKLRHSREFHDALEVLSSNRELFLSFVQEPDSLFSRNLYEMQSLSGETKCITILRPSKMVDAERFSMRMEQNDKLIKHPLLVVEPDRLDVDDAEHVYDRADDNYEDRSQPTRIVVLKPSTWKNDKMKTLSSPCFEDSKCDDKLESSDVTWEIPGLVLEELATVRRDETLFSSVYSNGYTSDNSTFYKSASEVIGNLSDCEVTSTPRHSWDFVNKVGSPHSISSFSRESYSPESSVCREAKKRLSERWALMASHRKSLEPRHLRNDSGTLGEMLSLLNTKKSVSPEEGVSVKEQQLIGSTSCSVADSNKEEVLIESPKCLVRSKSVPVSSSFYSNTLVEGADPEMGKSDAPKEAMKKGRVNSSFRGRISSLFSFRSRRSNKEKSSKYPPNEGSQSTSVDKPGDLSDGWTKNGDDGTSELVNDNFLRACSSPSHNSLHPEDHNVLQHRGTLTHEVALSTSKDVMQNQDHHSPISVLDPSFEEDDNLASESPGVQAPGLPLRFNLIDKSPPIGSIARTLSWDDSINEATVPYLSKSPNASPIMEEGLDWLAVVQTLISDASFDGQLSLESFMSRWYSSKSPLDPSLREKFANGPTMPEAKCWQRRSELKLAFDCVNIALVKATGCCESSWSLLDRPDVEARNGSEPSTLSMIGEHVWAQMKEWFSDEVRCMYKDDVDSSLVVEKVVRNEVVGRGWIENSEMEMYCLRKDIELKLLGELVDEAVRDLTGRV